MAQQEIQITAKQLQTLYAEIAKSITSSLEISTIIAAIMEQVRVLFKPSNWSLLRLDPNTNELYFVIAEGLDADTIKNLRIKIGEGVAGQVALTGKSIVVPNVAQSSHFNNKVDQLSGFRTTSLIAVPIIFQNKVLGVIELINTLDEKSFFENELTILETIADFSAIALNNAIIHEQISMLATHDPLTELYNRGFLNQLIAGFSNPASLSARNNWVIAILIDVDNFKQINDKYGHAAGDKVLVKIAAFLKSCCRKTDYVFRIGGDEFLMILTHVHLQETKQLQENLKDKLMAFLNQKSIDFSFSFGVASGKSCSLEDVILEADSKMYQSKQARS